MNLQLLAAIREKRLIEVVYKGGRPRIIEPHDYGIRGGVETLLAYQVDGESHSAASDGWKQFEIESIQQLRIFDRKFPNRPQTLRQRIASRKSERCSADQLSALVRPHQ